MNPRFGLLVDPGLGKTSDVLMALKIHKKAHGRVKALIFSPKKVMQLVWPAEVAKWSQFADFDWTILHGPAKEKRLHEEHELYFVNYEGTAWLLGVKAASAKSRKRVAIDARRIRDLGFTHIIFDELTKVKNYGSIRFKALKQAVPFIPHRWGLTGSPAANGLINLFGQIYILDDGVALGTYITHYRDRYFYQEVWDPYTWYLQKGADKKIYKRLAPITLRLDAEDYVKLPKLMEVDIPIELPGDVMKTYKKLERHLVADLANNQTIIAMSKGVAANKLRQLTGGAVYLDRDPETLLPRSRDKREWQELHTEKLEALSNLIEELQGKPLFVLYEYQHELERIQHQLGGGVPCLSGAKDKEIAMLEKAWNQNKIPVLLSQPQSVSHGLNLQGGHARHICWYTPTWDYELYDQLICRLRRRGNEAESVISYRLVASRTVDELVVQSLSAKDKCQETFFKGLQRLQRGYFK
jgi:SNF2 family DNA or RNA helicase